MLRPLVIDSVRARLGESDTEGVERAKIDERDYYTALERFLTVHRTEMDVEIQSNRDFVNHADESCTRHGSGSDMDCAPRHIGTATDIVSEDGMKELEMYHLQHVWCGGWLFDHEAHFRHSYFPSNLFPLASHEEYTFFMRTWPRNVNYPYAKRLYERGGRFRRILDKVPSNVCPCVYLTVFNVIGAEVWHSGQNEGDGWPTLARISVENEMVFRSDFFQNRHPEKMFLNTNRWIYNTFIRPYHDSGRHSIVGIEEGRTFTTASGITVSVTRDWFRHTILEKRIDQRRDADTFAVNHSSEAADTRVTNVSRPPIDQRSAYNHRWNSGENIGFDNDQNKPHNNNGSYNSEGDPVSDSRLARMRDVLNELYLGRNFQKKNGDSDFHDRILARCEDHRSPLYSPLLSVVSCKHESEEVSFVQRRSGDEISTEIRRCTTCGRVRTV